MEAAIIRGQIDKTLSTLKGIGLEAIELSDNIVELNLKEKTELIKKAVGTGEVIAIRRPNRLPVLRRQKCTSR